MKMAGDLRQQDYWVRATACALALFAVTLDATAAQASFTTPDEAVAAMVDAVRLNNGPLINVILGPGADALIHSGDPGQDQRRRVSFVEAYDYAHRLVAEGDKALLHVGKDDWPMPIPLVKSHGEWRFDTKTGAKEILARRIGRNELAAIEVCRAIVDAQREYAARDIDGDGILEYAEKIASTPGKHDGLYWEAAPGEPRSPLGPFLAVAANEGQTSGASPAPYHGYFYRVLSKQGKNAPGGARDYMVRGKMIGGFAVVAYPARYRASGVMSFIVSQDGVVYEKNLGTHSAAIARKMTSYDPDATWKRP